MEKIKVTIRKTYEIDQQRLEDLLTSALEGGSNYWYWIEKHNYPPGLDPGKVEFPHIQLPFLGGSLTITVPEDGDGKKYTLNKEAMIRGIKTMAKKYPHAFDDFIEENDDAYTGDTYLQCCLFGEEVYG